MCVLAYLEFRFLGTNLWSSHRFLCNYNNMAKSFSTANQPKSQILFHKYDLPIYNDSGMALLALLVLPSLSFKNV
jgi:hypothetical protein